jgi:hypothetical protein
MRESGPNTFPSNHSAVMGVSFKPTVSNDSGPLYSDSGLSPAGCAFTWRIRNLDTNSVVLTDRTVGCTEITGGGVHPGRYRVEGYVYLSDTDQRAEATYDFVVTP